MWYTEGFFFEESILTFSYHCTMEKPLLTLFSYHYSRIFSLAEISKLGFVHYHY